MSNGIQTLPPAPAPNLTITNFAQVLRARAVTLLKAMNTLAGPYVDSSRAIPVAASDSPRLMVWCRMRQYNWIGDAAPQYDTIGHLLVIGYVTGADHDSVEANTELLGDQVIALMNQQVFLASPVKRIASIDVDFDVKGDSDRFEGEVSVQFGVLWNEIFEPVLYPNEGGYGQPFEEVVVTIEETSGEILTGATIALSQT